MNTTINQVRILNKNKSTDRIKIEDFYIDSKVY